MTLFKIADSPFYCLNFDVFVSFVPKYTNERKIPLVVKNTEKCEVAVGKLFQIRRKTPYTFCSIKE